MSDKRGNDRSDAATFLALFGLLAIAVALVAFTGLVLPHLFFAVMIVFVFVFIIAFHYFVWGRWMSNRPPNDEDETE